MPSASEAREPESLPRLQQSLSVDVAPMTDLDHRDNAFIIVDNVENPELALADSVTILAREFLAPLRSRIVLQRVDLVDDPRAIRFSAHCLELFRRGGLDEKLIAFHCASSP